MKQLGLVNTLLSTRQSEKLQRSEYIALQNRRMEKLVHYAKSHSCYYNKLYSHLSGEPFPITNLPPTNKVQLMAVFDDWLTDKKVTLDIVYDFMRDKDNIGHKLHNRYLIYTTSGSTGNPAIVLADKTVYNVSAAISVLRSFARKSDFKEYMRHGKKTAGLYAVDGFYLASGSMKYNQRRMPWRKNQLALDVLAPINESVEALNAFQPAMMGSYPSTLELLIKEQETGRLHIAPVMIMPGGEYLREDLRNDLAKTFHCYVQTNYSCTEAGLIACECEHNRLHINEDWCIVEAVDDENKPIPAGIQSKKVLLPTWQIIHSHSYATS